MPPKHATGLAKQALPILKARSSILSNQLVQAWPRTVKSPFSSGPPTSTSNARQDGPDYRRIFLWSSNIVAIWCGFLMIRDYEVRVDAISGSSMAPTINPFAHETGQRDWVIFRAYLDRGNDMLGDSRKFPYGGVQRGDVVTFWKPHKPDEVSIKRVVAVEGDTVYPKRGYALDVNIVNGERLQGMPDGIPDNDPDSISDIQQQDGKIVVPFGHIWVEGDNARKSLDSNDFGPISKGLVKEKAIWIWRGWSQFLRVEDMRSKKEKAMGSLVVPGRIQPMGSVWD